MIYMFEIYDLRSIQIVILDFIKDLITLYFDFYQITFQSQCAKILLSFRQSWQSCINAVNESAFLLLLFSDLLPPSHILLQYLVTTFSFFVAAFLKRDGLICLIFWVLLSISAKSNISFVKSMIKSFWQRQH